MDTVFYFIYYFFSNGKPISVEKIKNEIFSINHLPQKLDPTVFLIQVICMRRKK